MDLATALKLLEKNLVSLMISADFPIEVSLLLLGGLFNILNKHDLIEVTNN